MKITGIVLIRGFEPGPPTDCLNLIKKSVPFIVEMVTEG